jgi:hypothetical protein
VVPEPGKDEMKNCPLCHGKMWVVCTEWKKDGVSEILIEHRQVNGIRPAPHKLVAKNRAERRNLYGLRMDIMRVLTGNASQKKASEAGTGRLQNVQAS